MARDRRARFPCPGVPCIPRRPRHTFSLGDGSLRLAMTTRRSVWQLLAGLPFFGTFVTQAQAQEGPTAVTEDFTDRAFRDHYADDLPASRQETVDQINEHLKHTGWFASSRRLGWRS